MWLEYEFFPKASDPPPLTSGIFEALFSLFPKLFNKNFKKKILNCFKPFGTLAFVCF